MPRIKPHACEAGTLKKIEPYLMMLAHYHEVHGGHANSYTGLTAPDDMQGWPDVYIVSDPKIRQLFKDLTASIRARENADVQELERLHGLSSDDSARRKPRGPGKRSGT